MSAGATLVLLYHRGDASQRDPHGLAVHPDRFAQHCEILQRRFRTIALSDWNRSGRHVAITFDDGYADNALEAHSILAAAGLPATFFITPDRSANGKRPGGIGSSRSCLAPTRPPLQSTSRSPAVPFGRTFDRRWPASVLTWRCSGE